MNGRILSIVVTLFLAAFVAILSACGPSGAPGAETVTATITPESEATPLVTQPAPATAAQTATSTVEPPQPTTQPETTSQPIPEEATPTAMATAAATTQPTATSDAPAPTATRSAPGVVVTSEPHVDVWSYGAGVDSDNIRGTLQTSIAFLNSLILDDSGESSLGYLAVALHAEALAGPDDGLVLGIDAGYTQFELNYLGASGSAGQVEAILIYENGNRARHLIELQRSSDLWYVSRVHHP